MSTAKKTKSTIFPSCSATSECEEGNFCFLGKCTPSTKQPTRKKQPTSNKPTDQDSLSTPLTKQPTRKKQPTPNKPTDQDLLSKQEKTDKSSAQDDDDLSEELSKQEKTDEPSAQNDDDLSEEDKKYLAQYEKEKKMRRRRNIFILFGVLVLGSVIAFVLLRKRTDENRSTMGDECENDSDCQTHLFCKDKKCQARLSGDKKSTGTSLIWWYINWIVIGILLLSALFAFFFHLYYKKKNNNEKEEEEEKSTNPFDATEEEEGEKSTNPFDATEEEEGEKVKKSTNPFDAEYEGAVSKRKEKQLFKKFKGSTNPFDAEYEGAEKVKKSKNPFDAEKTKRSFIYSMLKLKRQNQNAKRQNQNAENHSMEIKEVKQH